MSILNYNIIKEVYRRVLKDKDEIRIINGKWHLMYSQSCEVVRYNERHSCWEYAGSDYSFKEF